ncbi:zinc metalloproteinase-disintegrin-like crotastatin [Lineus longissimus]|uniref:zinc metalloproteinase-disintegrin-like crotastatin n=1 Tax=Lineus longissimus TaxID=88925 RepID=UPI00315D2FD0
MLMSDFCAVVLALIVLAAAKTQSQTVRKNIAGHPDLQFLRDFKVVIPKRIVSTDGYTSILSTKSRERTLEHHSNPSFSIVYNSRNFVLDLQLHRTLISGNYIEIYTSDNGTLKQEKIRPEACHYHGSIRGSPDSVVVMSTCDGLRGHFSDEASMFHIQPHPEFDTVETFYYPLHVVYEDRDIKKKGPRRCGHNATILSHPDSFMQDFADFKIKVNNRLRRNTGTIPEYNTNTATKYIELFLVFDHNTWQANTNRDAIRARAISMVNTVDSIYKPANVRVILTGVQIWDTGNPVNISAEVEPSLFNFCSWRKANLIGTVPHDIAHLIVGLDFTGNTAGLGIVGTTCTNSACGINQDFGAPTPADVAFIIAHEMGHNLGMLHDDGRQCGACDWAGGCVMASVKPSDPRAWTQCSIDDMNEHSHVCLSDYPTTFYADAICGNGYVEAGEECDCGSAAECPTVDPCCQTTGCKLKSSSECGAGECCENCKFKTKGTLCRNAHNECDIKDLCTGSSNVCPADDYHIDGTECNSNQSYCLTGECVTGDDQCKYWFGPLASEGDPGCFSLVNSFTNQYGHCGETSSGVYKKCAPEDYKCGKLQCSHPSPDPVLPIIGTKKVGTSVQYGSLSCKAASAEFGDDVRDAGLVRDGTKCGDGKMCYAAKCKTLVSLAFNKTSASGSTNDSPTTTRFVGISTDSNGLTTVGISGDTTFGGSNPDTTTTPIKNAVAAASASATDLMTVGVSAAIATQISIWSFFV